MELSGVADARSDVEPVLDATPVATVCVTEGDTDVVTERSPVAIVGVTDTVREEHPEEVRDTVLVIVAVDSTVITVRVTDCVTLDVARPVTIV